MEAEAAEAERLALATAEEDDAPSDKAAILIAALFFGGGLAFLASRDTLPCFELTSPLPEVVLALFCRSGSLRLRVSGLAFSSVPADEESDPEAPSRHGCGKARIPRPRPP